MEDIVSALIPVTFLFMLVLERLMPARPLPKIKGWLFKGFVFFLLSGGINTVIPALVGPKLGAIALLHTSWLGVVPSALVALLLSELLGYWTHRVMHHFEPLWRWTHQMHHSAERVDVPGAVLFHPVDMAITTVVTTAAIALVGASADAGALAGFLIFVMAMFQHLNVNTPRFIGYVVQRPEGHSVHHQRGLHAYNYGNIALWDQVFGTYQNPAEFSEHAGFWDGSSGEMIRMLIGRNVVTPPSSARPVAMAVVTPAE